MYVWGASSTHRGQGALNKKVTGEHTLRSQEGGGGGIPGRGDSREKAQRE